MFKLKLKYEDKLNKKEFLITQNFFLFYNIFPKKKWSRNHLHYMLWFRNYFTEFLIFFNFPFWDRIHKNHFKLALVTNQIKT